MAEWNEISICAILIIYFLFIGESRLFVCYIVSCSHAQTFEFIRFDPIRFGNQMHRIDIEVPFNWRRALSSTELPFSPRCMHIRYDTKLCRESGKYRSTNGQFAPLIYDSQHKIKLTVLASANQ